MVVASPVPTTLGGCPQLGIDHQPSMKYNREMQKEFKREFIDSIKVLEVLVNVLNNGAIKATMYVTPKLIIRAVQKTYKANGGKPIKGHNVEVTVTVGKPNYLEREFIKACQKAGEPFPVKKIQLKFPNSKPAKVNGRPEAKRNHTK